MTAESCAICHTQQPDIQYTTNLLGVTKQVCKECAPGGHKYNIYLWECSCEDVTKCTHRCNGCEEGYEAQALHRCQNYGFYV